MTLTDALSILLTPSCWIQINAFSEAWDRELTRLLDQGERFIFTADCRARIGSHEVWTANHPYSSFTCGGVRPRRATILRAFPILMADRFPPYVAIQRHEVPIYHFRKQ